MIRINHPKKEDPYILIVDDDEDDHHFLTSAIRDVMPDAIIKSLYDGTEVVDLLQKGPHAVPGFPLPDLIFLDINMSKLSGKKTTLLLKKDKHVQHIPIIILTTASADDQKKELLGSGADDFYTKPANIHVLKTIVEEIRQKWL